MRKTVAPHYSPQPASGFSPAFPRSAFVPLCLAIVPLLVLPTALDSFELPKRLVWGALALGLAFSPSACSSRCPHFVSAAVCTLLVWMSVRSFAGAPFWRAAMPLVAWVTPLALFLLAARVPWSGGEKRMIARTVAVLGAVEATLMLCQRIGFDPLFGATTETIEYAPGRMVGTVGYQNQAAEFLCIAIVCAVAGWKRLRTRAVFCALLAGTVFLTANRGAMLALAAAGAVVAVPWIVRSRRPLSCAAAAVLTVVVVVAVPEARGRFGELVRPSDSVAVQSRIWMDRVALSIWRDHPVAGAGAGDFAWEYVDRLGALQPERKEHAWLPALVYARETHCDPLQFAAEFGFIGLLLLASFALATAAVLRKRPRQERVAAAAVAVFATVSSLFSFTWQTSLAGPLAGVLVGMWASGAEESGSPRRRSRLLPAAAVVPVLSILMFCVVVLETAASLGISGAPLHGTALAETAERRFLRGDPAGAAVMLEEAERTAVSPSVLRTHAAALAAAGRPEEASAVCERWARCGIRHCEALKALSSCREKQGDAAGAAKAESERLRLFPGECSAEDRYRLAALFMAAGKPLEAIKTAKRFRLLCKMKRLPESWTPRWENLYGGALFAIGKRDEARRHVEEALRRDPSLKPARRNLEQLNRSK